MRADHKVDAYLAKEAASALLTFFGLARDAVRREDSTKSVPSEVLEPAYAFLIGAWVQEALDANASPTEGKTSYYRGTTIERLRDLRSRISALESLATELKAVHCSLACGNYLRHVDVLIEVETAAPGTLPVAFGMVTEAFEEFARTQLTSSARE